MLSRRKFFGFAAAAPVGMVAAAQAAPIKITGSMQVSGSADDLAVRARILADEILAERTAALEVWDRRIRAIPMRIVTSGRVGLDYPNPSAVIPVAPGPSDKSEA